MLEEASVSCPWCGEPMDLEVDPSGGATQEYVEDCWVCCHPCVVTVRFDDSGEARVTITQE